MMHRSTGIHCYCTVVNRPHRRWECRLVSVGPIGPDRLVGLGFPFCCGEVEREVPHRDSTPTIGSWLVVSRKRKTPPRAMPYSTRTQPTSSSPLSTSSGFSSGDVAKNATSQGLSHCERFAIGSDQTNLVAPFESPFVPRALAHAGAHRIVQSVRRNPECACSTAVDPGRDNGEENGKAPSRSRLSRRRRHGIEFR